MREGGTPWSRRSSRRLGRGVWTWFDFVRKDAEVKKSPGCCREIFLISGIDEDDVEYFRFFQFGFQPSLRQLVMLLPGRVVYYSSEEEKLEVSEKP